MDENLVGYLLKTLDPEAERAVERALQEQPDVREQLDRLRRALRPLEADREADRPPSGLWVRTLARIAEHRCRVLPFAPPAAPNESPGRRPRWRRADALVAALLLVFVGGLVMAGAMKFRAYQTEAKCRDNLRLFHQALVAYSDRHNGEFPRVEEQGPLYRAGGVVVLLREAEVLPAGLSVTCPGHGFRAPPELTVEELRQRYQQDQPRYVEDASRSLGCYAYTLGYVVGSDDGGVRYCGLRRGDEQGGDAVPIMGDAPPFTPANASSPANSSNHAGRGQHVLFVGGNVEFRTTRSLGHDGDIYKNSRGRIAAGSGPRDVVLGAGWAAAVVPEVD